MCTVRKKLERFVTLPMTQTEQLVRKKVTIYTLFVSHMLLSLSIKMTLATYRHKN